MTSCCSVRETNYERDEQEEPHGGGHGVRHGVRRCRMAGVNGWTGGIPAFIEKLRPAIWELTVS